MLMQLLAITRVTFTEAVRQPIFVVLLLAGTLLMVLNPSMAAYSMEPGQGDNRMLVDLGLGTVFFVGVFLAAFTATGVINQEMQNKTALTVISKPVPRPIFIAGKFLGVSGAITIAIYLLILVFMFTLRHRVLQNKSDPIDWPVMLFGVGALFLALGISGAANYLYKKVFASTFTFTLLITLTLGFAMVTLINKEWAFQNPTTDFLTDNARIMEVAIGGVFLLQGLLILTAFAVALSTRFSQVVTLVICIGVIMPTGMMAGAINQLVNNTLGIASNTTLLVSIQTILESNLPLARKSAFVLAKCVYAVAPNFQFHWPTDAITQGHSLVHDAEGNFSLGYLGRVTAYSAMYITAVLALAVAMFQKREVS